MNLVTILVILLCLIAVLSAVVVLSAIALGGRARQFEAEERDEPIGARQNEPSIGN
jgi:hypothetical protein